MKMKRTQEVRENKINEEEEKQWDKAEHLEEIKADTELPEEYYLGLEDLPWNLNSLEQLLYISLPAWIQRALLCNLAEQFGIWTFHNNILLCPLISYTLLPFTLPASSVISFIYRFLCWVKKIPHQALNAGREFKQKVIAHLRFVFAHLRGLVPNRFLLSQILPLVPMLSLFLAPLHLFLLLCFPVSLFLYFLLLYVSCHAVSPLQPQRSSPSAGARLRLSGLDGDLSSASSSPDPAVSAKRQIASLQMQRHNLQPSSCSSM